MKKAKIITIALALTTAALLASPLPASAAYDYNRALQLDGNDDYVQVEHPPNIAKEMAVEAWIKTTVVSGDQGIVGRYNNFSGSNLDDQFLLSVHNGVARFQINPGNLYVILDGTRFVADGQWHHIAATYAADSTNPYTSSPTMTLYVDGSYDGSRWVPVAMDTPLNNPTYTKLRIGALYDNGIPGFFFKGLIDEVRLWRKLVGSYKSFNGWSLYSRFIPLHRSSGVYPVIAGWRFNGYPDTGNDAFLIGGATEVPVSDLPVNKDSALLLGGRLIPNADYKEYVNVLGGGSLKPSKAFTIEAQIKTLGVVSGLQSVVSKYRHNSGSNTDDAYFLGIEPRGVARFQISVGSSYHIVQGITGLDGNPPFERWHHLAGVFDGTRLYLYVDGRLEAISGPLTGTLPTNNTPLYIGASQEGPSGTVAYPFVGVLDDVRIWDRALSATEILNSANGLLPLTSPIGLLANWMFEGDFINMTRYRSFFSPTYWGIPQGAVKEEVQFCNGTCPGLGWTP